MNVTNAVLSEATRYLVENFSSKRDLCRYAGIQPRTFYMLLWQLGHNETPTMGNVLRQRVYDAAIRLKSEEDAAIKALSDAGAPEEAEAIKKLQDEEK